MTSGNSVPFLCKKEWGFPLNMYVRVCVCALTGKMNDNAVGNEFFKSKGSRQPQDHWL